MNSSCSFEKQCRSAYRLILYTAFAFIVIQHYPPHPQTLPDLAFFHRKSSIFSITSFLLLLFTISVFLFSKLGHQHSYWLAAASHKPSPSSHLKGSYSFERSTLTCFLPFQSSFHLNTSKFTFIILFELSSLGFVNGNSCAWPMSLPKSLSEIFPLDLYLKIEHFLYDLAHFFYDLAETILKLLLPFKRIPHVPAKTHHIAFNFYYRIKQNGKIKTNPHIVECHRPC